jgi:hypothetical protein
LSRDLKIKCLAPVVYDGFEGAVFAPSPDCKIPTGPAETFTEDKDPIRVEVKIGDLINEKPDLAGIKVRVSSILPPEKNTDDRGIIRTLVELSRKPTEAQRPILCRVIADALLSAQTSRDPATVKRYLAASCRLVDIEKPDTRDPSVKRQDDDSKQPAVSEILLGEDTSSSASFIPRDFVVSMVFLVVGLFFAW